MMMMELSKTVWIPNGKPLGNTAAGFYRQDALHVTQPTALKH